MQRLFFVSIFSLLIFSFTTTNIHIDSKSFEMHGIDVSHHQDHINWDKVAENERFKVHFSFIKATEGVSLKDKKFRKNWEECKNVDIKRGAYHFFISSISPKNQALNYIKTVSLAPGDLAPVLDFENESAKHSVAATRKNLKIWLNLVENHYNIKPIIYTNSFFYKKYIKGHFKNYHLWIADYDAYNIKSSINSSNLKFWQYSQRGKVNGIKGHVDCNAFVGDIEEFDELVKAY
jgi:lysozyme